MIRFMDPAIWADAEGVRAELARNGRALGDALCGSAFPWVPRLDAHDTLLSLRSEERIALLRANERTCVGCGVLAQEWASKAGRFEDAWTLLDDLVAVDASPRVHSVALWAIQDRNSQRGVQPERARAYLAAGVPCALSVDDPEVGNIFVNAACVLFELDDRDALMELVGQLAGHPRHEAALRRIREDERIAPMLAAQPKPKGVVPPAPSSRNAMAPSSRRRPKAPAKKGKK